MQYYLGLQSSMHYCNAVFTSLNFNSWEFNDYWSGNDSSFVKFSASARQDKLIFSLYVVHIKSQVLSDGLVSQFFNWTDLDY